MELKAREESPTMATTTAVASESRPEDPKDVAFVVATTRPVPIKGKRRNLGRQARKRRKKYLEIEAAASAFVAAATAATLENPTETACNPEDAVSKTKVLPTDRGYVLEDVQRKTVLSEEDRRDLIRQLGYLPGNALRVVARIEDAFSSQDLKKVFDAAAVATEGASRNAVAQSTLKTDTTSFVNTNDNDQSTTDTNTATNRSKDKTVETNEERDKRMASMIQNMMKEPLVIKLYPLALRDESSSTKRRRKRRRDEDAVALDNHQSTTIAAKNAIATTSTAMNADAPQPKAENSFVVQPQRNPLMEPFPTIYWVTHPLIKALISKLELDRVNVQFEDRLADEEAKEKNPGETHSIETNNGTTANTTRDASPASPLESMKRAHKSYGRERRELLSSKDREYVKGRKWYGDDDKPSTAAGASSLPLPPPVNSNSSTPPFSEKCGVAGIRNPKAVKCLHAHAAHYWSGNRDNLVGQWVWERLRSGRSFFQGSIEHQTN